MRGPNTPPTGHAPLDDLAAVPRTRKPLKEADVTDAALADIIQETDELRQSLPARPSFTNPEFLRDLASTLKKTKTLSRQPIAQCFIDDAEHYEAGQRLEETKRHINEASDTHVFSLFNASYFPALSLDYLVYDPLPVDET